MSDSGGLTADERIERIEVRVRELERELQQMKQDQAVAKWQLYMILGVLSTAGALIGSLLFKLVAK